MSLDNPIVCGFPEACCEALQFRNLGSLPHRKKKENGAKSRSALRSELVTENSVMPIEVLYIVPILALAFLAYRLVLAAQKRSETVGVPGGVPHGTMPRSTEDRLNEYERTIAQINSTLAAQQKTIERSREQNSTSSSEIEKLTASLRELHKEYDIVISENYSLRAKVKSLQKRIDDPAPPQESAGVSAEREPGPAMTRENIEMNMSLYDDTKVFQSSSLLDDTNEINTAEAG